MLHSGALVQQWFWLVEYCLVKGVLKYNAIKEQLKGVVLLGNHFCEILCNSVLDVLAHSAERIYYAAKSTDIFMLLQVCCGFASNPTKVIVQ